MIFLFSKFHTSPKNKAKPGVCKVWAYFFEKGMYFQKDKLHASVQFQSIKYSYCRIPLINSEVL